MFPTVANEVSITNSADCEVSSMTRLLKAKTFALLKSIANLSKCMGKVSRTRGICVRTDMNYEARSGSPSVITEFHFCENRRFTVVEPHEVFQHVSLYVLREIVTVQLRYRNICVKWVPRILTDEHVQLRIG